MGSTGGKYFVPLKEVKLTNFNWQIAQIWHLADFTSAILLTRQLFGVSWWLKYWLIIYTQNPQSTPHNLSVYIVTLCETLACALPRKHGQSTILSKPDYDQLLYSGPNKEWKVDKYIRTSTCHYLESAIHPFYHVMLLCEVAFGHFYSLFSSTADLCLAENQ